MSHATSANNSSGWLGGFLLLAATLFTLAAPAADLATLGERGANPRLQEAIAILADAKASGAGAATVARRAIKSAGYQAGAAKLTADALLRNLDIASKLGCLDATNLAAMHRGHAPTIRTGPYAGEQATVDHIIPRAIVPELDHVIANLELLPARLNESKGDKISARQLALARKFHQARLLSTAGLTAVEAAAARTKP